jgi:hypothetical protein
MRILFLFLPIFLIAGDFEYKGNISLLYDKFYDIPSSKRDDNKAVTLELELKKDFESGIGYIKTKALKDSSDKKRKELLLNEIYYKHIFENSELLLGKNIRFWGSLELHNLTDVFNAKDLLSDPLDEDEKLGNYNIAYQYFFEESGSIELIAKLREEKQKYQDEKSVFNSFIFPYNKNFQTQKSKHRPTIYLKYNDSIGEDFQSDYSFVLLNGYDENRDFIISNNETIQYLYEVNKLMFFTTTVKDDTIYKLEYQYSDIKDYAKDNYYKFGGGIEHTLYGIKGDIDLGILLEYYKSDLANTLYQNDIFAGARITFNDVDSSELLVGVVNDNDTSDSFYSLEYSRRLFDNYKLKLNYYNMTDFDRLTLSFGYYF